MLLDREICALGGDTGVSLRLEEKISYNRTVSLLRFKLPREDQVLGVSMGQGVNLEGRGIHHPISGFDTLGYADFLVPESDPLG